MCCFFFSSRRRHTRSLCDWSSDVCSSDLGGTTQPACAPGPDGTVEGSIEAPDITGPAGQGVEPGNFVDLLRAIRKGETYTNVHTGSAGPPPSGRAPGGEIRGQNRSKHGHDD